MRHAFAIAFSCAIGLNATGCVMTHVNKSAEQIQQGQYNAALEEATRAIEENPRRMHGYINRAIAYQSLRQYDLALADYQHAIAVAPDEPIVHLDYVEFLVFRRRVPEAVTHAGRFLAGHRDSILAKLSLALALLSGNEPKKAFPLSATALRQLDQASWPTAELLPIHRNLVISYALYLHARIVAELGRSVDAQRLMQRAATYRSDFNAAYWSAKVYYSLHQWDAAVDALTAGYDKASPGERESSYGIEARFLLGNASLKLGKLEEAREAYETFLAVNPVEPEAFFNLATVYARMGELSPAIQNYSSALELDSTLVDAYSNRGTLLLQAERYDEAIRDFSSVLSTQPRDRSIRYKRAYALCAAGRGEDAQNDLNELLASDSGDRRAKELARQCHR